MKNLKLIILSSIIILVLVVAVLIFTTPKTTPEDNLEDVSFEELFTENDFPDSLSEEEVLDDFVDIGELFD
mgnify:CR=1 FL=1